MRGRDLATASLSRDYGLNTGFVFVSARPDTLRRFYVVENEARPCQSPGLRRRIGARPHAVVVAAALRPGHAAAAGTSRGENFSAKPPAAAVRHRLHRAGCHKGPQGLGKKPGPVGLTSFLREHYTNSRQSAAALAEYLSKIPERAGAEGGADAARRQARGRSGAGIERPWRMVREAGASEAKPAPNEARNSGQSNAGHPRRRGLARGEA